MSDGTRRFKVLVAVSSLLYVKFYESVLRALAADGHRVHVVADRGDSDQRSVWLQLMKRLTAEHPGIITFAFVPPRRESWWVDLAYWVNRGLEHLRFFAEQFDRAPVLRRRVESRAWGVFRRLASAPRRLRPWIGRALERVLVVTETAIADTRDLEAMIAAAAPDVVIVTPLVTLGAAQGDVVTAAQHCGIPTAVAVGSWDHLSSKVRIRVKPDRLLVWNETQRAEAFNYHGFPRERVDVTGAQCFDQWFGRSPSRTRADFCRELGLPEDRPLVLYVGSALFWGSPSEAAFTARWVRTLRASPHEALRNASIVIRPHPKRGYEWDDVDLSDLEHVVVWPPRGQPPLDAESKAAYFDSLYHSAAVVGLNTSAQIEAGLIGRPVYTVLLPEFWDNQEGTLHFSYLLNIEGGLLHAARSLDEHGAQLVCGLTDPAGAIARNEAFVRAFVRPHGLETPATAMFVDAVTRLAAGGRIRTSRRPWWAMPLRALLLPWAVAAWGTPAARSWISRPLYPIPDWAWSLRTLARPAALYAPWLVGSEHVWRVRYDELQSMQRARRVRQRQAERLQRRESLRAETRAQEEARRSEARAARLQRRLKELAARDAALRASERESRAKHARRRRRELKKTAVRTARRGMGLLRAGVARSSRGLAGTARPSDTNVSSRDTEC